MLEASHINPSTSTTSVLWNSKSNIDKKTRNTDLLFALLVDLSQQQIIKMVLEPQWESKFFPSNYGLRSGRSHHDALEQLYSNLHNSEQFIANINLSSSLSILRKEHLIEIIRPHWLIKKKIEKWLDQGLMDEYFYQSSSFDMHMFEYPNGAILAPLLVNMILNDIEFNIYVNVIKKWQKNSFTDIICYGYHWIIISESIKPINKSVQLLRDWLESYSAHLNTKDLDFRQIQKGFNFLNYQIILQRKGRKLFNIVPSVQTVQLFIQGNREIIQSEKSGPISTLVSKLKLRIVNWGKAYSNYHSQRFFIYIDKILFSQIRAVVLRKHSGKSKYWIYNKYFPANTKYYFKNQYYMASWVLTDTNSLASDFLPKMQWLKRKHYVKVIDLKSVYDKDEQYWQRRL